MSALDPRVLALIHADIDGELDDVDRAELERRLAESPEARAFRDDLGRMTRALERIRQEDPPVDLKAGVVAAALSNGQVVPLRGNARRRPALQVGLALAAGVALAAIGLAWLRTGGVGFDATEVVGTMGQPAALQTIAVATPEIRGTVALRERADGWVIEFDLASADAIEVGLRYDGGSVRLAEPAEAVSGDPAQGRLTFVNTGKSQVIAHLQPKPGAAGAIRVEFQASGRLLHEASLQVPASAR